MIRFKCPTCQTVLKAPDEGAGRKISCPKCGQRMLIPQPEKPTADYKKVLGEPRPEQVLCAFPACKLVASVED